MDIEDVRSRVTQAIYESGRVGSAVYAELDQKETRCFTTRGIGYTSQVLPLNLFLEGHQAGQRLRERELMKIIVVTHSWMAQGETRLGFEPSLSALQRDGVLFLRTANTPPFSTTLKVYRVKQYRDGREVQLIERDEIVEIKDAVGLAFLAGWYSRALSKAEALQLSLPFRSLLRGQAG